MWLWFFKPNIQGDSNTAPRLYKTLKSNQLMIVEKKSELNNIIF